MKNIDSALHVRGESVYVNDIPVAEGTLYAAVFGSPSARGRITALHLHEALACAGVERILTARDIPGENQIGSILPDEELMADPDVHYRGMPVALAPARTEDQALRARNRIRADIEERPPLVSARDAFQAGSFICPSRTFRKGDVDTAWAQCAHLFEGRADMGGTGAPLPGDPGHLRLARRKRRRGRAHLHPGDQVRPARRLSRPGHCHAPDRSGHQPPGRRLRRQGGPGDRRGRLAALGAPDEAAGETGPVPGRRHGDDRHAPPLFLRLQAWALRGPEDRGLPVVAYQERARSDSRRR